MDTCNVVPYLDVSTFNFNFFRDKIGFFGIWINIINPLEVEAKQNQISLKGTMLRES